MASQVRAPRITTTRAANLPYFFISIPLKSLVYRERAGPKRRIPPLFWGVRPVTMRVFASVLTPYGKGCKPASRRLVLLPPRQDGTSGGVRTTRHTGRQQPPAGWRSRAIAAPDASYPIEPPRDTTQTPALAPAPVRVPATSYKVQTSKNSTPSRWD